MEKIKVADFDVIIHKNALSRSLRLRVDRTGQLVLSMPKWVSVKQGIRFVTEQSDWIEQQLQKRPRQWMFQNGMTVCFLGQNLTIMHDAHARRGVWIEGDILHVSGDETFLHRRVCDFMKRAAYPVIQKHALALAAQINEKISKITLKDVSTRWGSCSADKKLVFCWRLALAPDFVLDYIIAHEVAHLREMNHGPAFWRLTTTLTPHKADANIWLRKHGAWLQALK